jgi:hypothetical protein
MIFLVLFVLSVECQLWPCQWVDNGIEYDLRSVNTNISDRYGLYQTSAYIYNNWIPQSETDDWFFWKLCDPTTRTLFRSSECANGTHICGQYDKTFGVGPPIVSLSNGGYGLTMTTYSEKIGCEGNVSATYLYLKCSIYNNRASNTVDQAFRLVSGCGVSISLYLKEACGYTAGTPTPTPTPQLFTNNICCQYVYYDNPKSRLCICADGLCPVINGYKIMNNYADVDCGNDCNQVCN